MAWWNPLGRTGGKTTAKRAGKTGGARRRRAGGRKAGASKASGARKARARAGRTSKTKKKGGSGARKRTAPRAAKAPAAGRASRKGAERIQLRWIAQARSGDKGDIANIALFAPTEEMYDVFRREVTVAAVKKHFGDFVKGKIERYEVPNVRALNFVAHAALGGGGASSLRSDPLGKSYGSNLLRMEIDVPADVLARTPKWRPPRELPEI